MARAFSDESGRSSHMVMRFDSRSRRFTLFCRTQSWSPRPVSALTQRASRTHRIPKNAAPPVERRQAHGRGANHGARERGRAAGDGPAGPIQRRRSRAVAAAAAEDAQSCLHAHEHALPCPKHVQSESLFVRTGKSLSIVQLYSCTITLNV